MKAAQCKMQKKVITPKMLSLGFCHILCYIACLYNHNIIAQNKSSWEVYKEISATNKIEAETELNPTTQQWPKTYQ